jgi:RNA polymerase sigma-70 factor (ECF subfamily)
LSLSAGEAGLLGTRSVFGFLSTLLAQSDCSDFAPPFQGALMRGAIIAGDPSPMTVTGSDRADDLTLVRRCLGGDEDAWRRLVRLHRQGMIDLARRILPGADAADVVDAVLADVWERRKLARFAGRSALATWLGAVTINAALNAKRSSASRLQMMVTTAAEPGVAAPRSADRDDASLARTLRDAIAVLPPDAKLLVLMYYEQGLTLDQAAMLLRRSKSTLSRSLQQARDRIRDEAERIARERFGTTLAALRAGTDLSQLEFDLRAACAHDRDRLDRPVSNS